MSETRILPDPASWIAQSPYGDNYHWKYDGDDKIEIHCEVTGAFEDMVDQDRWAEINIRTGVYTYMGAETAYHAATMNN